MSVALLAAATVSLGATSGAIASRADEDRPREDKRGAPERSERPEGRDAKRGDRERSDARPREGAARQGIVKPRCSIAEGRLLQAADNKFLAKLKTRLDALVAADKISRAKADRLMKRAAITLTLNTVRHDAAIAPLLELFDMTREQFRMARADGLSPREIAEDEGISRDDLRAAMRKGRENARAAVNELCGTTPKAKRAGVKSGSDAPRPSGAGRHREHRP